MRLKHFTYAGSWKKFEPVWNFIIKKETLFRVSFFLLYFINLYTSGLFFSNMDFLLINIPATKQIKATNIKT